MKWRGRIKQWKPAEKLACTLKPYPAKGPKDYLYDLLNKLLSCYCIEQLIVGAKLQVPKEKQQKRKKTAGAHIQEKPFMPFVLVLAQQVDKRKAASS